MKRPSPATARRGFTLMEMLVVLAILVFLVSMVVPRVLGTQKQADIKGAKTQIGMLKATLERYALDCKTFPTTDEGLQALLVKPADLDDSVAWAGPYVSSDTLPKDPWGHDYKYEYPPTHGTTQDRPDIWSMGPDGQDGTDDDITSWTVASDSGSGTSSGSKSGGN
jgi:general secretion pathway protein G